jgi:hypothetical protein
MCTAHCVRHGSVTDNNTDTRRACSRAGQDLAQVAEPAAVLSPIPSTILTSAGRTRLVVVSDMIAYAPPPAGFTLYVPREGWSKYVALDDGNSG